MSRGLAGLAAAFAALALVASAAGAGPAAAAAPGEQGRPADQPSPPADSPAQSGDATPQSAQETPPPQAAQGPPADEPPRAERADERAADSAGESPPSRHGPPGRGRGRGAEPRATPSAARPAEPASDEAASATPRRRVRIHSIDTTIRTDPQEATERGRRRGASGAPRAGGPRIPDEGARERRATGVLAGGASPGTVARSPAPEAPAEPGSPAAEERDARPEPSPPAHPLPIRLLPRPVRHIVEVVPRELWAALGVLALLALALAVSSWLTALRARRLSRQRAELLEEVGLLQAALLPPVPRELPVSVAYRPAEGPAAGGDFYDAFALDGERTAIILGDVAGHGRDALARTTFIRYTLRAYLEAGLEPREVLKVGSEALTDRLGAEFATVIVAVHEPPTGRFTYACAGHLPPIVIGRDGPFEPVIACAAPPVGFGEPTGFRQTTLTLAAGSLVCLYTDGVIEARVDGRVFGMARLERAATALPPDGDAAQLLDEVAATADEVPDDMAVCLVRAEDAAPVAGARVEEFEVDERDVGDSLERFLRACGVPLAEVPGVLREAGEAARREGSATVRVRLNDFRPGVDVVPANVVRLDQRRAARRT